VQALYAEAADERLLSRVNEIFIRGLCGLIGLETCIRRAAEFDLPDDRNDRLIALCRQVGASEYLSGPAAKGYLDCGLFARQGISVRWMSYDGYPEYRQLFRPPFVHEVSILDLLFAEGAPGARDFLLSSRRRTAV
jgi:molybdopterin/thiamine biosynthesis adenylyltransferase